MGIYKFIIGDDVSWECKPYNHAKFKCYGRIESFKTAAGYKEGASVVINHEKCPEFKIAFPKRNKTCVGLDKLTKY